MAAARRGLSDSWRLRPHRLRRSGAPARFDCVDAGPDLHPPPRRPQPPSSIFYRSPDGCPSVYPSIMGGLANGHSPVRSPICCLFYHTRLYSSFSRSCFCCAMMFVIGESQKTRRSRTARYPFYAILKLRPARQRGRRQTSRPIRILSGDANRRPPRRRAPPVSSSAFQLF